MLITRPGQRFEGRRPGMRWPGNRRTTNRYEPYKLRPRTTNRYEPYKLRPRTTFHLSWFTRYCGFMNCHVTRMCVLIGSESSRAIKMNIFRAGCFELPKDWINVQADLPAEYGDLVTLSCREKFFQIGDKVVTCNPTFSIQDTPKCLSKSKLQRSYIKH